MLDENLMHTIICIKMGSKLRLTRVAPTLICIHQQDQITGLASSIFFCDQDLPLAMERQEYMDPPREVLV
jgi:hypothetical protein